MAPDAWIANVPRTDVLQLRFSMSLPTYRMAQRYGALPGRPAPRYTPGRLPEAPGRAPGKDRETCLALPRLPFDAIFDGGFYGSRTPAA
jgi:hypothetical protein